MVADKIEVAMVALKPVGEGYGYNRGYPCAELYRWSEENSEILRLLMTTFTHRGVPQVDVFMGAWRVIQSLVYQQLQNPSQDGSKHGDTATYG